MDGLCQESGGAVTGRKGKNLGDKTLGPRNGQATACYLRGRR